MSSKKLIQQYVTTGLELDDHQFGRLSNNFKKSYLRSRIIGYSINNPLSEWELESLDYATEESQKLFFSKIPDYALGTKKFLEDNGIGGNMTKEDIKLTKGIITIPFNYLDDFIENKTGVDIEKFFNEGYLDDFHFYDVNSFKYALIYDENEKNIKEYIELTSSYDIKVDEVGLYEALIKFKSEYPEGEELVMFINSSVSEATMDEFSKNIVTSVKENFSEWGEVTINHNFNKIQIKTSIFDNLITLNDFYASEIDELIHNFYENKLGVKYIDFRGLVYELIGNGVLDKPKIGQTKEWWYYEDDNFNEILKERLNEL